jgi:hypothetical protein
MPTPGRAGSCSRALEAAADRWDYKSKQSHEAQLRRRHPGMYEQLSRKAPEAVRIVAKSLSRVLGTESKMIDFVLAHTPKPPTRRLEIVQLDFDDLEPVLASSTIIALHERHARRGSTVGADPCPICPLLSAYARWSFSRDDLGSAVPEPNLALAL